MLLAVSGGPDSTALLLMAASWSRRRSGPRIEAATFDHGLRPEGAVEAAAVAALCSGLGVPHQILPWRGDKPGARLQERAREARYAALGTRAKEIGADVVVTAHHLDDQAETVLFRLARGSGISGLAGMAARVTRGGVTIARPLLEVAKSELVAYCEAENVAFARDPSNADPRFARARMRAWLAAEGLDAAALVRLARRARQVEDALAAQTAAAEARLRLVETGGCDAAGFSAEPIEIQQRLLMAAIARVGGRDASRVGLEKIEALAAALRQAIDAKRGFSATLAGARIRNDGKGQVRVGLQPPRAAHDRPTPDPSP